MQVLFAGEKVRPDYVLPAADFEESEPAGLLQVVALPALVRMKLTSFRDKDRMHLRDLIELELVDESLPRRFPSPLDFRLQSLLDDPSG